MIERKYKYPVVLTIAGSDSGGGAGIQADLKTFSALGCFGTSVITALTAQNTLGVTGIHSVPPDFVKAQMEAVLTDIRPDAIKIGMVHTPALVEAIANTLADYPEIPVVFDPVMIASSGHRLIEEETVSALVEKLFPIATLITPNLDEAALLAGMPIASVNEMHTAGDKIMELGCKALLLKGGHLTTAHLTSLLYEADKAPIAFTSEKIDTQNMHGSGCTLSSAIAAFLARGYALPQAVGQAQDYVHNAIVAGADVLTGTGHGPLNHFFNPEKLIKNEME
ncbi:bifunctional hydroxymethylpyrimidine kinase/phosphomethylpyrimidine kinase [Flavobacterium sp. RHBU_3]|uniref:bifunctional hydroxymethylpyrimidine kinase/phosphomethylpyrimidine kinase n=1 Tax=Flavobacterium sp. RHBU_3 TaxID=3391184 RepID=UPI00398560C7